MQDFTITAETGESAQYKLNACTATDAAIRDPRSAPAPGGTSSTSWTPAGLLALRRRRRRGSADPSDGKMDFKRAFVRIYRLPAKLTDGYCFSGGVPITFVNMEWFERPIEDARRLVEFVSNKRYFDPHARFLVIGNHPDLTFNIERTA